MERGQIALFFIQRIFSFVQVVAVLKTLHIFDHHLKPIRMKNILSFIAQVLAAFVVVMAYLFTLEYFGI